MLRLLKTALIATCGLFSGVSVADTPMPGLVLDSDITVQLT